MKMECVSLQKKYWDPTNLLQQTKQNKTKNKNKDAPRTTYSAWSKNKVFWKKTWDFIDEEGDALGIPKI